MILSTGNERLPEVIEQIPVGTLIYTNSSMVGRANLNKCNQVFLFLAIADITHNPNEIKYFSFNAICNLEIDDKGLSEDLLYS